MSAARGENIKAVLWVDEGYEAIPGGHRVQVQSIAAGLRELGAAVEIATDGDTALDGVDVVHSIGAPLEWTRRARSCGIPVVVTPIYGSRRFVLGLDRKPPLRGRLESAARFGWSVFRDTPAATALRVTEGVVRKAMAIESADLALPNSLAEAEAIRAELSVSTPMHVVPNCADHRLFSPPPVGSARSGVLYVARIEPHKNQLGLIKALAGADIGLTIVGPPHPHHLAYRDACLRAGGNWVRFVEGRSHAELVEIYRSAAVHAMPSFFETTGLVSLEAALCGAAVVTTSRGYVRDYFEDDAEYCDPAEPTSIRDAVLRALAAGPSEVLRQRVITEFSVESMARRTLQGYRLAVERART